MNAEYPSNGKWRFRVNQLVASGETVVTQAGVTDGTQAAKPILFFTVRASRIVHLVEYWPEPLPAAENPRHLTERWSCRVTRRVRARNVMAFQLLASYIQSSLLSQHAARRGRGFMRTDNP